MEYSVAPDYVTDFSTKEPVEDSIDCGCYGPKYEGMCTYIGDPVCGCDGVTYGNPCTARINGIYIFTRGRCEKTGGNTLPCPIENPPVSPCGHTYAPVCGFNGITYKNACEAKRAGMYKYFNGKCWK